MSVPCGMGVKLPISEAARTGDTEQTEQTNSVRKVWRTVRVGSGIKFFRRNSVLWLDRNVELRLGSAFKQHGCHRSFPLDQSDFVGPLADGTGRTVLKRTSRLRLKAKRFAARRSPHHEFTKKENIPSGIAPGQTPRFPKGKLRRQTKGDRTSWNECHLSWMINWQKCPRCWSRSWTAAGWLLLHSGLLFPAGRFNWFVFNAALSPGRGATRRSVESLPQRLMYSRVGRIRADEKRLESAWGWTVIQIAKAHRDRPSTLPKEMMRDLIMSIMLVSHYLG